MGTIILWFSSTNLTSTTPPLSSCDECSVGYKREDPSLGKLSPCVECQCNGYSKKCDADTGMVLCRVQPGSDKLRHKMFFKKLKNIFK